MFLVPAPCGPDCTHIILEHLAFDAGWFMAERGASREQCALHGALREAWEYGWDYGTLLGASPNMTKGQADGHI